MNASLKMKLAAGLFVPALAIAGSAYAQTSGVPSTGPDSSKGITVQDATKQAGTPAAGSMTMADKEALFKRLDTNNDGVLSAAEAQKDDKVHGKWKQFDTANKGSISRADFLSSPAHDKSM